MSKITKVVSRQIFDSRGIPTIETEIFCGKVSSKAICPSGASTGSYEAFEKRDVTNKKYLGKSVFSAVSNVNNIISKKILNKSVHNQELNENDEAWLTIAEERWNSYKSNPDLGIKKEEFFSQIRDSLGWA